MSPRVGPLGVFDSGVGGLTVVGALLRRFPGERILYVADQAHVPYGGRPLDEVCGFASAISEFLAGQGCRAIVMACNISSATALPCVQASLAPLPVLGVIEPAARRAALEASPTNPCVGVLATQGTVRSGAYSRQIRGLNPGAYVVEVPCPTFVPLVEGGETEGARASAAAREYLTPLAQAGCRQIILGCTHYPFLLHTLQDAAAGLFDTPPCFIDPADEMAAALADVLPDLGREQGGPGSVLLTTGDAAGFAAQAKRFLPGVAAAVSQVCWDGSGALRRRP